MPPVRAGIAAALWVFLGALALAMPLAMLERCEPWAWLRGEGVDDSTPRQARLAVLRGALPPAGRVGYASPYAPWSYDWMLGYFHTQYAVAPVVVLADPPEGGRPREAKPPLTIANFEDDESCTRFAAERGLAAHSVGRGLAVLGPPPR